jgi:transcriptional regulator with XRE-family HTH domain
MAKPVRTTTSYWWRRRERRARREEILKRIGRAALRLRLFRGWSQREVELATDVDQTTVSRLERGADPGPAIGRLAAILDVLIVGDIDAKPAYTVSPTNLELMLFGDRWQQAADEADRRLRRPKRAGATISTRSSSELGPVGERPTSRQGRSRGDDRAA